MDDDGFLILFGFFWLGIIGILVTGAVLSSNHYYDNPGLTDYQQNICSYEGGQVKDDVCIVDGKVFEIEKQR